MVSIKDWLLISVILLNTWPFVAPGSKTYSNRISLDSSLYHYAFTKLSGIHTGKLYNVSLPPEFAGMQVSAARLRASALWNDGANYSSFSIPPAVLPFPFAKRVDLVFQNLGNWSSFYYQVPNHTFVAPVIGFLAYDSNTCSRIQIEITGSGSFVVQFPNPEGYNIDTVKCVRFDMNGTLEFSLFFGSSCVVRKQGHFSVVVPNQRKEKKRKRLKAGIGIVAGLVGLILLALVAYKWIQWKMIAEMERQAERSVGLDIIWIGHSRMPSAPGIRTQPVLETSSVL